MRKILQSLAVGTDQINNHFLWDLFLELAEPLCQIFNKSIRDGVFPTLWKKANVCPVFKRGDAAIVSNYRPISLLSTVSKVFEHAVYAYILNHMSYNNSLTEYQSGFLSGDSDINQFTYLYHKCCEAIDSGKEILVNNYNPITLRSLSIQWLFLG